MLSWWADKSVRLSAGLGLVLVAMMHGQFAPTPVAVPNDPEPSAAEPHSADDPAAADKENQKKSRPVLPQILPEAPAPRWSAVWGPDNLRSALRDGIGCTPHAGDANGDGLVTPRGDGSAWLTFLAQLLPAGVRDPQVARPPDDPALQTCIRPLAPPRA